MAVAFNWKIERLECYPQVGDLENVVGKVHWRLFGHDGEVQESIYGTCDIPLDAQAAFVPFEALTEATIVAWVQAMLGTETVDRHEASLAQAVDARLDPPVVPLPLPWSAA